MTTPEENPTRCVLVVDDNVWMQRILTKILQSYGLKPVLATNGYEAVAQAVEYKPVAIILDIIMPDLSGHQTLRLLKTIPSTKNIPVLMITVASDSENLGMAIKLGASGFIRKPFTRATIFEKLSDVLGTEALFDADTAPLQYQSELTGETLHTLPPESIPFRAEIPTTPTLREEHPPLLQARISAPLPVFSEHPQQTELSSVASAQTASPNTPPSREHLAKTYGQEPKPDIEAIRSILSRSTPRS